MATQAPSVSLNMFSLPVLHINTEQSREKLIYNTNSRQIYYAVMLVALGPLYPWGVHVEVQTVFLSPDFWVPTEHPSLDTYRSFLGGI